MRIIHSLLAKLRGYNTESTPVSVILQQMSEPRPLPMGRRAFEEWSDRIISGALVPGASPRSLKFALAEMIMHAKPTDDHIADAYFIKCLRKGAANQVAWAMITEIKASQAKEIEDQKKFEAQIADVEGKTAT